MWGIMKQALDIVQEENFLNIGETRAAVKVPFFGYMDQSPLCVCNTEDPKHSSMMKNFLFFRLVRFFLFLFLFLPLSRPLLYINDIM